MTSGFQGLLSIQNDQNQNIGANSASIPLQVPRLKRKTRQQSNSQSRGASNLPKPKLEVILSVPQTQVDFYLPEEKKPHEDDLDQTKSKVSFLENPRDSKKARQ